MPESISCSERAARLLARVRQGETPHSFEIKLLGEECPADFFRIVIESLADSFDLREAAIYEELMGAWIPPAPCVTSEIPSRVDAVYVLSRVTLGADIKIVSPMLAAMRARFPDARIVFVSNKKSAGIFEAQPAIKFLHIDYPRGGSISARIGFAYGLRARLNQPHTIVIDPDSRMTQLGLVPACEPERYFHFPSRTAGGDSAANLSDLVGDWLKANFGLTGAAWIAPKPLRVHCERPIAAISLGVGENETKRVDLDFEMQLISLLATRFRTVYLDRGAGGAEAARVTAAALASGAMDRIRFHEGSFAAFASIIAQSDFYVGYDSAGQHAAAAAGTPLVTIFKGAPSARFLQRWAPESRSARVIDADAAPASECLGALETFLPGHW